MRTDILDELFRVRATLEHVLLAGRVDDMEKRFLREAIERQNRAVKQIALLQTAKVEKNSA